ncbi:MAG: hypothetical protein PF485_08440 [Bacteroidales bacterium]|jgi:hypothetical protein|nr:hypothetical protein [Bacteroidales bacterium]
MNSKINNIKLGMLLGIIAPVITLIVIYLIKFTEYNFQELIDLLIAKRIFTKIISLCVFPNLALFFLFLNRNYYSSARGVLMSTVLFAMFVFIIKFAL